MKNGNPHLKSLQTLYRISLEGHCWFYHLISGGHERIPDGDSNWVILLNDYPEICLPDLVFCSD